MNDPSGETPAPSPEPVRLPERFRTENKMTALYARFALDRDALNPQKKDLPETAQNQLTNLQETVTKAGTASTMERQNINYSKDRWAEMMVEGFAKKGNAKPVQKIGERKIGGLDFSHATKETFLTAYQKYFADDGQGTQVEVIIKDEKQYIPARLNQFVEDILSAYPNKAELKADLATIEWFAGVFGEESKKIIRSILETKLILDNSAEKTQLVNDAKEKANKNGNETIRVNWVEGNNKEEERQLTFLWGNSHDVERRMVDRRVGIPPTPPEPTPPHPSPAPTPEPPGKEQTPLPDRPQSLEDMFTHVVGPVDKNQPYFIQDPPAQPDLNADEINKLMLAKPLLVNFRKGTKPGEWGWQMNPEVKPWVPELEVQRKDQRFMNGEKATQGDSGLFGLIAASAETPRGQAKLYKTVADVILFMHKESHLELLSDFLKAQGKDPMVVEEFFSTPLGVFKGHGFQRAEKFHQQGKSQQDIANELLLVTDTHGLFQHDATLQMWDKRISELNMALQNNKLEPHHLRWIEFLSHSVDVAEMMKTIKNKQETPSSKGPWERLPKPQQPLKIKEKEDIQIPGGKGILHQRETYLIIGTKDHPLVTETVLDDGSRVKSREMDPERPYQIPLGIYFDSDVTPEQKQLIQDTLPGIIDELGTPRDFLFEGESNISNILTNSLQNSQRKGQMETNVLHDVVRVSEQRDKPHNVVIFTNKDLYSGETNFVIGSAITDEGTVISLSRIWNSVKDPQLRNNIIKTEIAHEIGHVYDLPSNRRGRDKIDNSLGPHCKNAGCSMKQGLSVPKDWITITQDRLRHLGNHYFCADCQRDLKEKFKITPKDQVPAGTH